MKNISKQIKAYPAISFDFTDMITQQFSCQYMYWHQMQYLGIINFAVQGRMFLTN